MKTFSECTKRLLTLNFASSILYHTMSCKYLSRVLKNNKIQGGTYYEVNKEFQDVRSKGIVSLTRDKDLNYGMEYSESHGFECIRFTFDGKKLNTRYKIIPDADMYLERKDNSSESEEKLIGNIDHLNRYLTKIEYLSSKDFRDKYCKLLQQYTEKYGIPVFQTTVNDSLKTVKSEPLEKSDYNDDNEYIIHNIKQALNKHGAVYDSVSVDIPEDIELNYRQIRKIKESDHQDTTVAYIIVKDCVFYVLKRALGNLNGYAEFVARESKKITKDDNSVYIGMKKLKL